MGITVNASGIPTTLTLYTEMGPKGSSHIWETTPVEFDFFARSQGYVKISELEKRISEKDAEIEELKSQVEAERSARGDVGVLYQAAARTRYECTIEAGLCPSEWGRLPKRIRELKEQVTQKDIKIGELREMVRLIESSLESETRSHNQKLNLLEECFAAAGLGDDNCNNDIPAAIRLLKSRAETSTALGNATAEELEAVRGVLGRTTSSALLEAIRMCSYALESNGAEAVNYAQYAARGIINWLVAEKKKVRKEQ